MAIFTYSSIAMQGYISWVQPYRDTTDNRIEQINEASIYACGVMAMMIEQSRGSYSPEFRLLLGWIMIGIVLTQVLVNLIAILKQIYWEFRKLSLIRVVNKRLLKTAHAIHVWDSDVGCKCQCPSCGRLRGQEHNLQLDQEHKFGIKLKECKI